MRNAILKPKIARAASRFGDLLVVLSTMALRKWASYRILLLRHRKLLPGHNTHVKSKRPFKVNCPAFFYLFFYHNNAFCRNIASPLGFFSCATTESSHNHGRRLVRMVPSPNLKAPYFTWKLKTTYSFWEEKHHRIVRWLHGFLSEGTWLEYKWIMIFN